MIYRIKEKLKSENPISALFEVNNEFQVEDVFKEFDLPLIRNIEDNLQLYDVISIKMDGKLPFNIFNHAAVYLGEGDFKTKEIVHVSGEGRFGKNEH